MDGDSRIDVVANVGMAPQFCSSVHLEVLQKPSSDLMKDVVEAKVVSVVRNIGTVYEGLAITSFDDDPELKQHIEMIKVCDIVGDVSQECKGIKLNCDVSLHCHVYQLNNDGPEREENVSSDIPSTTQWFLPCREFHGLWESLIYDSDIKIQLVDYISTSLLFAEKLIDPNIIAWNNVVLLHGPPGTGKTSLCKALAQKVSIRMERKFTYSVFIEINPHSLFSKWFSESGRLVLKMFQQIEEYAEDPNLLVFVLIDEVESIAQTRKVAMGGADPSDAIRVVNALLTQIDHLKRYQNVTILTTSNVTGAVDVAFVDRADIKQFIGLPSANAIYEIYRSCIEELNKKGFIYPAITTLPLNHLGAQSGESAHQLMEIARSSQGLSGRTLRKLPFLAFALYIQNKTKVPDPRAFLSALQKAVWKEFKDHDLIAKS